MAPGEPPDPRAIASNQERLVQTVPEKAHGDEHGFLADDRDAGPSVAPRAVAFSDFPPEAFPFRVEFLNASGTVVHTIECEGPGVVEVPGLADRHGTIRVRLSFPDGHVVTSDD